MMYMVENSALSDKLYRQNVAFLVFYVYICKICLHLHTYKYYHVIYFVFHWN